MSSERIGFLYIPSYKIILCGANYQILEKGSVTKEVEEKVAEFVYERGKKTKQRLEGILAGQQLEKLNFKDKAMGLFLLHKDWFHAQRLFKVTIITHENL